MGQDRGINSREFRGHFAEIIAFNSKLPDATRQKVEGYLAHKWGLVGNLPSNHPYRQSVTKQPKIGVSSIGTNSAAVSANLVDLGGAATSLKVVFAKSNGTILETPETLSGLKLWLDASDLNTAGSTWTDQSGQGNDASKNGSPSLVPNAQNGKSVIRYLGANSDYHEWSDINDIRSIFWVVQANGSNSGFLLGDDNQYHFHHNDGNPKLFWHSGHTSANIRNGNLRVNGLSINGLSAQLNSTLSSLSIISLKTTGNVEASRFSRDRTINGRNWNGDLGELLYLQHCPF